MPIKIGIIEKMQSIRKSYTRLNLEKSIITLLTSSTAYVTGLANMKGANHDGKLFIGKSAPDKKTWEK
ncbi:MAG: hypothetical protein GKB99_04830 [Methanocellales archaeon]|nr:hypothetical protein [Methanocellales archaeon]